MELSDYLSDQEKAAVQRFLADPVALEAVRKVFLSGIYQDGVMEPGRPADPLKNFVLGTMTKPSIAALPFAEKGMKIQTIIDAVGMVESGFELLKECRPVEAVAGKDKVNKAR